MAKSKDKKKAKLLKVPRPAATVAKQRSFKTRLINDAFSAGLLILGVLICAFSISAVLLSFQRISVTETLRLQGVLQAIEQSTPVKHNRGGVVNNIFVTEGEVVQEGQILASLDTDDIADDLSYSRRMVGSLLLESHCIQSLKAREIKFSVPGALKQTLGKLQLQEKLNHDRQACQAQLEQLSFDQSLLSLNLSSLEDKAKLYQRLSQTELLLQNGRVEKTGFEKSDDKVEELAELKELLKTNLKSLIAKTEFQKEKIRQDKIEAQRIAKLDVELERISEQLVLAQSELTRLNLLLKDKFIYASTSGRVQRMRIKERGRKIAAGAYVLEIAPLDTDFEITGRINIAEIPNVKVNGLVHVKLSGGLPKPVWVPAKIEKILKVSENQRVLSIRMVREELNKRDLLMGDHSLNGLGERSEAIISIQKETALETLSSTIKKMDIVPFLQNESSV